MHYIKIKGVWIFFSIFIFVDFGYIAAQSSQNVKLKIYVADMAGASSTSSEFKLTHTIGQLSAIGYSNDNNLKMSMGFLAQALGIITVVEELQKIVPEKFFLNQNYPNPFNPSTTIEFGIAKPGMVKIRIWNIMGQLVMVPIDKKYSAGTYRIIFDASNLVSGIYFCQIEADEFREIKKMILEK